MAMRRAAVLVLLWLAVGAATPETEKSAAPGSVPNEGLKSGSGVTFVDRGKAVLHGLDKITARVSELTVLVGESMKFGRLLITVKACRVRPPEEPPESAAFLDITDLGRRDTRPSQAFHGWMFASSPAVSAMDHPVYDIWVAGCV
jgi:hypothetical protein